MLNYVIRMVVPMKREFGASLDVQQFMRDAAYSKRILEQARTSQDQRLRDYADYVSRHLHGARDNTTGASAATGTSKPALPAAKLLHSPTAEAAAASPAPRSAPAAPPAVGGEPSAEELRARMLKKYTSGLR
jgi:hypothetical protein